MPETEPRPLKWIHLDDFSPGIADRDLNSAGHIGPWPLGTATVAETFRCQAVPNGALGPLPRRDTTFHYTYPGDVFSGQLNFVGFAIQGRVDGTASGGYDEANWIIATEYLRTGLANQRRAFKVQRQRMWDSTAPLDTITTGTDSFASGVFRPAYLQSGRIATAATTPGTPVLCFAWWGDPGTDIWNYWPNPATPTANTALVISAIYNNGPMIVYQGRSLVCHRQSFANALAANAALWETNEMMFFTNSNLATVASLTASLFTPEDPGEIMGLCVSSANELFVLKYRHGAYVIRGDITFPTVLRVPGIQGTGKMPQIPLASPIGVLYKSHGSGMYVWPGGETSENISSQMEPENFRYSLQANWAYGNFGGTMEFHEDLIFVPPRWVYNMRTKTWWQLEDPADTSAPFGYLHFQKSVNPNSVIAVRGEIQSDAEDFAFAYNFDFGQTTYQWTSHPIHLSVDSQIEVREIALRATGPTSSTVTINIIAEAATESHVFTIGANNYPRIKVDSSAVLGGDVQIQIIADGASNTAPIVFNVDVAYMETNALPNASGT